MHHYESNKIDRKQWEAHQFIVGKGDSSDYCINASTIEKISKKRNRLALSPFVQLKTGPCGTSKSQISRYRIFSKEGCCPPALTQPL